MLLLDSFDSSTCSVSVVLLCVSTFESPWDARFTTMMTPSRPIAQKRFLRNQGRSALAFALAAFASAFASFESDMGPLYIAKPILVRSGVCTKFAA